MFANVIVVVALLGAAGFGVLGLQLQRVTAGRNDAHATTPRVIRNYLLLAGLCALICLIALVAG